LLITFGVEQKVLDVKTTSPAAESSSHTSEDGSIEAESHPDADEPDQTILAEPNTQVQEVEKLPLTKPPSSKLTRRLLERVVRLWVPKTPHDLMLIKQNSCTSYLDCPYVASRTALASSLLFILDSSILLFIGIGWNFGELGYAPLTVWLTYIFCNALNTARRMCNQIYFVLEEVDVRKHSAASRRSSTAPIIMRHGSSARGSSISLSTIRSLPTALGQGGWNLTRQGTEADFGLIPPTRRQTFPQPQE
jgi:hypothetical protein